MMRASCGLTKWCLNAAAFRRSLPQPEHAHVIVLTDDEAFAREECGSTMPRILGFDAILSQAIRAWAKRTGRRRSDVNLADARFAAATLRKWQLVSLIEYRVIFVTDQDVDIFFDHGPPPGRAPLSWARGYADFVQSSAQLLGAADAQIPVNTGVMLLKPSLRAYEMGLLALLTRRFSAMRGWNATGSPIALLRRDAQLRFAETKLVKENTWDVVCGNADQGLFTYVFLAKLDAYATSRYSLRSKVASQPGTPGTRQV